jgi:hypothetical protein
MQAQLLTLFVTSLQKKKKKKTTAALKCVSTWGYLVFSCCHDDVPNVRLITALSISWPSSLRSYCTRSPHSKNPGPKNSVNSGPDAM